MHRFHVAAQLLRSVVALRPRNTIGEGISQNSSIRISAATPISKIQLPTSRKSRWYLSQSSGVVLAENIQDPADAIQDPIDDKLQTITGVLYAIVVVLLCVRFWRRGHWL